MSKITESESNYNSLEKMNTLDILSNINKEDKIVAISVEKEILKIDLLVKAIVKKLENGGRLFYLGAGTSGRLGILDASECPPTFGVDHELVIGIIAGGDNAIRKAVEFAEDDITLGWKDLKSYNVSKNDFVIFTNLDNSFSLFSLFFLTFFKNILANSFFLFNLFI